MCGLSAAAASSLTRRVQRRSRTALFPRTFRGNSSTHLFVIQIPKHKLNFALPLLAEYHRINCTQTHQCCPTPTRVQTPA